MLLCSHLYGHKELLLGLYIDKEFNNLIKISWLKPFTWKNIHRHSGFGTLIRELVLNCLLNSCLKTPEKNDTEDS